MNKQRQSIQFNSEFEKKYKTTLDFLREYTKLKTRVKYYTDKIKEIQGKIYSAKTSSFEVSVSGGVKDERLLGYIMKLGEIEAEGREREAESYAKLLEIEFATNKVQYPYSAILRKYYLEGKTYEKIAVELNYSYSTIQRGIRVAVVKLDTFLNKTKVDIQ